MKPHSGYIRLLKAIEGTNAHMAGRVATVVNQALTLRNWLIGSHIVEYEQHGLDRARYGDRLLDRLSKDLKKQGVRGLDVRALRDCRLFFRVYPQIRGPVTPEFKRSMASGLLTPPSLSRKILERVPPPLNPDAVFRFSWTHMMEEGDNPPVGIILCSDKDQTVVEFTTAGMDNKLFVSRYQTSLPSADQLKKLVEADRAQLKYKGPSVKGNLP